MKQYQQTRSTRTINHNATWIWGAAWILLSIVVIAATLLLTGASRAHAATQAQLESLQPVVSSAGFSHPGVSISLVELKASKSKVQSGEAPWKNIYDQMASSSFASRGAPDFSEFASAADVDEPCSLSDPAGCVSNCGTNNIPDQGCTEELSDARAVYAQALMYWYTGDDTYAQRAIAILNAYATHFKGHQGSNGPLMTAWVTQQMLRGAEIIRYTYTPAAGDTAFNVTAFSAMLRTAYVDNLTSFDWYRVPGNWMGSGADGMMNAAIFLDDRDLYNQAVDMWRDYVPNYIYISSDGEYPNFLDVSPIHNIGYVGTDTPQKQANLKCLWLYDRASSCQDNPRTDPGVVAFQNGQTMETCRDMLHTSMGLGSMVNTAETAWIQGDDLYGEQQERIMTSITYAAQISRSKPASGYPTGLCNGAALSGSVTLDPLSAEVAYNHYTVRKGVSFTTLAVPGYSDTYENNDPVAAFIALRRTNSNPEDSPISAWESLTHHVVSSISAAPVDPIDSNTPVSQPTPSAPNTGTAPFLNHIPISLIGTLGAIVSASAIWGLWRFAKRLWR